MVVQSTILVSSDNYYTCDLTRQIPVRVSIVTVNGDTGFGIVESLTGEERPIKDYVRRLRASESTIEVDVTYTSTEVYWTRVVHRLTQESIHETILSGGCMTRLPIVIEAGLQQHVVLAPTRVHLANLLKQLRARFSDVRIQRVQTTPIGMPHVSLTKKQKEAVLLAFHSGYYEIPRRTTIAELCKDLNIKRVALQERLRRVERQVMQEFIDTIL
jgi:predicted DNA binding protein